MKSCDKNIVYCQRTHIKERFSFVFCNYITVWSNRDITCLYHPNIVEKISGIYEPGKYLFGGFKSSTTTTLPPVMYVLMYECTKIFINATKEKYNLRKVAKIWYLASFLVEKWGVHEFQNAYRSKWEKIFHFCANQTK